MERPDSHEIDALESLEISEGYRLIAARIEEMIERKRDALERTPTHLHGPEGIEGLQGFISACRTILSLPPILRMEIKSYTKEK